MYNEHRKRASAAGPRLRSHSGRCELAHPPEMSLTHPSADYKKGCVFMSQQIKESFILDLKRELEDEITAKALSSVMSKVSDVLEHYEFSRTLRIEEGFSMDLFDTWIKAMKVQNRTKKTINQYTYVVNKLMKDVNVPIRNITVGCIRDWLVAEEERGVSDCTREHYRQVLSSMFGWLWREGLIERNPTNNIGAIKVQKKVREPYTEVELETLKESCVLSRHPLRDVALMSFLLSTGCRVGEVVGIKRNDIDFQNNEVVVLGKGNKERTVFFDDVTAMYLKRYLNDRADLHPALFLSSRMTPLTIGGIQDMLRRRGASVSLQDVHPHKFRRTLATTLNAHGMPIQEVAAILGHDKLDTTLKYIKLDKNTIKSNYKKFA